MSTILSKPIVTPADLLEMPDGATLELVDGRLVEKEASTLSCWVEARLHARISLYCEQHNLGPVWTGTMGFQCFAGHPNKVRKPDVSFVKASRFTPEHFETGFLPIAPDLAGEVISPGDIAHEVLEKIEEYLGAGVPLIWLVEPELRIVQIYRLGGAITKLGEADELSGEDVLPGFRCRVADLFPHRPTQAAV